VQLIIYVLIAVLILKKDGTENDFFPLVNENTIPDYDIMGYLRTLMIEYLEEKKFLKIKLRNDQLMFIADANEKTITSLKGHKVLFLDSSTSPNNIQRNLIIKGGGYCYEKRRYINGDFFIEVNDGVVKSVKTIILRTSTEGLKFAIIGGNKYSRLSEFIGCEVLIKGDKTDRDRIYLPSGVIFELNESKIIKIKKRI